FAVLLDIPSDQAFRTLAALLRLLPVLLLDLRSLESKVHNNGFRVEFARQLHGRHQHVFQRDLRVFNLLATSLAHRQLDTAQVLAAGAVLHDSRSGFVDTRNDVQVVKAGLTGAQTTTAG